MTSTPAAPSRGSEAAIVGGFHGVVEISKLEVPSGDELLLELAIADALQSLRSKGAPRSGGSKKAPCRRGGTPAGRAAQTSWSLGNRTAAAELIWLSLAIEVIRSMLRI